MTLSTQYSTSVSGSIMNTIRQEIEWVRRLCASNQWKTSSKEWTGEWKDFLSTPNNAKSFSVQTKSISPKPNHFIGKGNVTQTVQLTYWLSSDSCHMTPLSLYEAKVRESGIELAFPKIFKGFGQILAW
jgi:hypothetical protein